MLLYGALSIAAAFAIQHIGGTFMQIVFSVLGTTLGPIVGMYFLGATIPRAGPRVRQNSFIIVGCSFFVMS